MSASLSPSVPASSFPDELFRFICSRYSRGSIFFAEDLECTGRPRQVIRVALSELVRDNFSIIRIARGVFCYPRLDDAAHVIVPDDRSVAAALARRWRVRIAPCSEQAATLAGLIPFGIHPLRFVSDGSEQHFNLQNGRRIEFLRRKSVKVFDFRSEALRNLVEGLRFLGPGNISDYELSVARSTLAGISPEDFRHDVLLAPGWIRELLDSCKVG